MSCYVRLYPAVLFNFVRLYPAIFLFNVRLYPYICIVFVRLYPYEMKTNKLQINHLESRIKLLKPVADVEMLPAGWIKAIRSSLGISLQQFAHKLNISRQSASEIEQRERDGSITLRSLKEAARILDMTLVYGFVPSDGSLEALIDRKARELAKKIVERTSTTMKLEDQENSPERIKKAIEERAQVIKLEMPKALWD